MDSNIAIRTLVHNHDKIHCWAGGGIVADSDLKAEYREILDKASAMLELLQRYGGHYECSIEGFAAAQNPVVQNPA